MLRGAALQPCCVSYCATGGAWCWDTWGATGSVDLAYQVFIPNVLYRVGVTQDAVLSMVKRTQWVDWGLNGQISKTNAWTTLFGRFKGAFGSGT